MLNLRHLALNVMAAFALNGCAIPGAGGPEALRVEPLTGVKHGGPLAALQYQLGRYHQGRGDLAQAATAYTLAIQADPQHVDARNGLAVLAALQGREEAALQQFRAAVAMAPQAAHVRNNLAYLLLRRGAHAEAVAEYSVVLALEPGNGGAAANLAMAQARLQAGASTARAPSGAGSVDSGTVAPAMAGPPQKAERQSSIPGAAAAVVAQPRIVAVAKQVYELRQLRPERMPAAGPSLAVRPPASGPVAAAESLAGGRMMASRRAEAAPPAGPRVAGAPTAGMSPDDADGAKAAPAWSGNIRLEVSNGNGLNGFAKAVSAYLTMHGMAASRLTNQLPFQQAETEIHYRQPHAAAAAELAAQLRPQVRLVVHERLAPATDVRLVLGKDHWSLAALARNTGKPRATVQVAAAGRGGS